MIHASPSPLISAVADQMRGRQALTGWGSGLRTILAYLAFAVEVGRSPTASTWSCGGRRAAPTCRIRGVIN
jgi:hypothetical protein